MFAVIRFRFWYATSLTESFPLKSKEELILNIHRSIYLFVNSYSFFSFLSKFTRGNSGAERFMTVFYNRYFLGSSSISLAPSFLDYSLISWLDQLLINYSWGRWRWLGSFYSGTVRHLVRDRMTAWEGFLVFRERIKLAVNRFEIEWKVIISMAIYPYFFFFFFLA